MTTERIAKQGGPWTTHGHVIPGVTVVGKGRPRVHRCGGVSLCDQCRTEEAAVTPQPQEPKRMGARVIDKDGDIWRKGRTRWSCEATIDLRRVTQVGRLPWSDLTRKYGPVRVLDLNDR